MCPTTQKPNTDILTKGIYLLEYCLNHVWHYRPYFVSVIHRKSEILEIASISRNQAGIYRCGAVNGINPRTMANILVDVLCKYEMTDDRIVHSTCQHLTELFTI